VGPPRKLTAELQERVCKALQMGVEIETACALEGIHRATFYEWRQKGLGGEEPYAGFYNATQEAFLRVDMALSGTILREAVGNPAAGRPGNWQAAAWFKKFRANNGRQQIELTGKDGKPLEHRGALTQETADLIRREILYGKRGRPPPTPQEEVDDEGEP
jgi:hypothetical protein